MKRTSSSLAILFAGFFLAACNTADFYTAPEGTVAVTVGSSFSTSNTDLSAQGVPYDPETGESGVTSGQLRVFRDGDCFPLDNGEPIGGDELFFDAEGNPVEESDATPQRLSADEPTVTLLLPPGTYAFTVESDYALGLACDEEIAGGEEVLVPMRSFIDALSLSAPEEVSPNEVFDVLLEVTVGPDLRVPASDYFARYKVESEGDVEIVGESNLGVRLVAGCDEITVTAFVPYNFSDVNFDDDDSGFDTSVTIPLSTPCADATSVGVDLVPPFISINAESQDEVLVLSGEVNDMQSGVDRIEIYEGPVFLGEVFFGDGDPSGLWFYDAGRKFPDDSIRLTAIAYDNAGNEGRAVVDTPDQ